MKYVNSLAATAIAAASALLAPTIARAADMPLKAAAPKPLATNWTGTYAGVNAGYGWGNTDSFFDFNPSALALSAPLAPASYSNNANGFVGGGQIGVNYQVNQYVFGVEADIQYSDVNYTMTTPLTFLPANGVPGQFSESQKLRWFGTVRGRAGVLATNDLLIYATGGLAYGQVDSVNHFTYVGPGPVHYNGTGSQTKAGWTVGGGGEWALNRTWSVKAEYLYYDLGSVATTGTTTANNVFTTVLNQKINGHIARLGLNYKFSVY